MTKWRRFRQLPPEQAIAKLRELFSEAWPYALVEEPDWSLLDVFRSEMAYSLVSDYDTKRDWPAALCLLIPPYPSDTTAWLNLLSLAHRALDRDLTADIIYVLGRAVTMLVKTGFDINDVVAFEAVNFLGGMEENTLLFTDSSEKNSIVEEVKRVTSGIKDPELQEYMTTRTLLSLEKGRMDPISTANTSAMEAAFRTLMTQRFRDQYKELGRQLEHTIAVLRAFSESQVHPSSCLGTAAIRVYGDPKYASGLVFGKIHRFLQALTEFLGQEVIISPATLVNGSVEVVCRLEVEAPSDVSDEEDKRVFAAEIGNRLERVLKQGNHELPTAGIGQFLGEFYRSKLSVDLELRNPDGIVRRVRLDHKLIKEASGGPHERFFSMIKSIDVPQADDLSKVFQVAETHEQGQDVKKVGIPKVAKRQWDYYRHAARILRLITPYGTITPAGLQLVRTNSLEKRMQRAAFLFEESEIGQAWLDWEEVTSIREINSDKKRIEKFLSERTEVGRSTVGRRASSLMSWLSEFQKAL